MHPRVTSWILEFVLRQPVDDWVANGLLFALPLPSPVPPRLKKTLLLRRLSSDLSRPCLSGRTLLSLELIEELDRSAGADAPSDSLAAAYAAVAVECTACFLRERSDDDHGEDFFDAVNRIWNCRVADLERSEAAGLVSPALGEARREMEEAVVNPIVRVGLMGRDTKKAALDAVRVYLDEADKEMGPPYLERMAKAVGEEWRRSSRTGRDGSVVELYEILLNLLAIQGEHGRREGLPDGDRAKTSRFLEFDKHEESVLGRDKDAPEQGGCSSDEFVHLPAAAAEVIKMKILSRSGVLPANLDNMEDNQDQMGSNPVFSVNEGTGKGPYNDHDAMAHPSLMNQGPSDLEHVEENRERASLSFVDKGTKDGNPGTSTSTRDKKDCAGAPKPSLVDRNRTARTFEWDEDSIESPSENSPNSSNKLHFRSPKRREISLPLEDNKTFIKRRTKRKWSSLEEETLKKAVERHGVGNWKFIKSCHPEILKDRTEVDLKDKWRNMIRCI
ncbi:uncharacterized protein LOC103721807 isoform X2 [Phoenix dactylifera]|uniref:Uncharacterized protein LOC103721807 isoform X2 n=1 Tax=Phoenix dactylifera TaxID=42345 RepID=A0A8B9AFI5_PHODC|nr:uncharacterized protein LOC103721807 isoform X2 [Phoenix dactylifera]XP_038982009.1 uncharacterized protein LOC103721807 isoform X2 [Phoenix dactylifera]